MPPPPKYKPHSAVVRLTLRVHGQDYDPAKAGPERVYLRTPVDLLPGEADLIISVDGRVSRRQITLVNGASADSQAVEIRSLSPHGSARD